MVAKVRERLAVSKEVAQKFDAERFDISKQSELEVRQQYHIKISHRSAALENLYDSQDTNRAWENIKQNIKTSAKESLGLCELKQHKPWSDEECLGFLDQRKQAKMQWLKDPTQSNVDHLNNVKMWSYETFQDKQKEYLKSKIDEIEINSKTKNQSLVEGHQWL